MSKEYILRNYMLEAMTHYIPIYIEEHRDFFGALADSPEFALKFKIAALNRLPSKYVTTLKGSVYSAFEMKEAQYSADINSALIGAGIEVMQSMQSVAC